MRIFGWIKKNKNTVKEEVLQSSDTGKLIDSSYSRRSKEIESLRKYDRGEKEITPSDLRSLSRGI